MADRAFDLIEIELPDTGSARKAIKNVDMVALWYEGWDVAYCWISNNQEVVDGRPKGQSKAVLNVVMGPPRATALSRTAEGLEQVLGRLEAMTTPEAPEPSQPSRWPAWWALAATPALVALGWALGWFTMVGP